MDIKYKDDVIVITIPCSKEAIQAAEMSKSGKSKMVAGTGGFAAVSGRTDLRLNLSLIAPVK